ncbi:MAG TPA: prepilin-type N-terminal cleavage/methylation domain-containing protein [Patescibacteria group bacterium]|nr:prepilin-type N-terminal cleavage/methylation domain-containing protein [Patescibacteria group bacterium]
MPIRGKINNRGITLIETIIGLTISALLVVILSYCLIIVLRLNEAQKTVSALTSSTDRGIYRISSSIQQSSQILSSAVIFGTTHTTSSSALVLKIPTVNSSGQIISGSYDTVVYRRNPSDLSELQEITDAEAGSARFDGTHIIARFVTNLLFRYNNSDYSSASTATVFLKTGTTVRGVLKESANQTTVRLRNL